MFLQFIYNVINNIYFIILAAVASRFQITKYPTIKVLINGQPAKREYRGKRSVDAFITFVQKQLDDPIQEVENMFVSTDAVDVRVNQSLKKLNIYFFKLNFYFRLKQEL